MMSKITLTVASICFFLLLAFSPLVQAGPGGAQNHISYQVKPSYRDSLSLDVSFQYRSDDTGKLVLRYENDSWGDKDIFNCIARFEVHPQAQNISFLRDSSLIIIETVPNQLSTVSYSIKQDFQEPLKNQHRYRPIIQKEYFHVLGMRLLITPDKLFGDDTETANVELIWDEPISGTIFHSSFGSQLHQELSLTREMLYTSFFVGGDFRRYSYELNGQQVYFVTRGSWLHFSDETVFELLKKTIPVQMAFWKDTLQSSFSVSLIPTFEEWTETSKSYSLGGSGLTNSFISFASNNPGITFQQLTWLYNHELLHKWIGQVIVNQEQVKQYWFSEGFTEYYAYKLMLRSKELDLAEYIEVVNKEIFLPHYKSSVNTLPNDELTEEKFWSHVKYHKLPYRRGFLYAFLLDLQLKQKSRGKKGLDHIMLEILQAAKDNPSEHFNHGLFKEILLKHLDANAVVAFEEYINQGKLIDFQKELPKGLSLQAEGETKALKIQEKGNTPKLARHLAL